MIVFIDFETTGLFPQNGEKIIEIGALKIDRDNKESSFQSFVNPLKPIPFEARAIHKIDDSMVKDAPLAEEAIDKFLQFIERSCLCGYNLDFDLAFLEPYVESRFFMERYFIDVLVMARYCFREFGAFSLINVCRKLQIDYPQQHRALDDAVVTGKVFLKCLDILKRRQEPQDFKTLSRQFKPKIVSKYENTF